jgi:hypothetical protein
MSAETALKKFADTIKDDNGRQRFKDDPEGTLGGAAQELPTAVLDKLKKLNKQDLAMLSELNETLVRAGLKHELSGGGGSIAIF